MISHVILRVYDTGIKSDCVDRDMALGSKINELIDAVNKLGSPKHNIEVLQELVNKEDIAFIKSRLASLEKRVEALENDIAMNVMPRIVEPLPPMPGNPELVKEKPLNNAQKQAAELGAESMLAYHTIMVENYRNKLETDKPHPEPPLYAQVHQALGHEVALVDRRRNVWIDVCSSVKCPSSEIPSYSSSVELATGALEEYCGKQEKTSSWWTMEHRTNRTLCIWIGKSFYEFSQEHGLPLAICQAIVKHHEGRKA